MPAATRESLNDEYRGKIEDLKVFIDENNMTASAAKDLRGQLDEEYVLKFRALKTSLLAARALHRQVCHTHFHTNGSECPNLDMCLNTHATNCQLA